MNELSPELVGTDALLRRAARSLPYAPTPRLADAVAAQLRATATPGPHTTRPSFALPALGRALALAMTALVIALGAAVAVPASRDAMAEFFGLKHARIEVKEPLGPTPPALSPQSFARPSNLADAQAAVDYPLRFPMHNGQRVYPTEVYVQGQRPEPVFVIFVYDGFDLYQTDTGIFGKGIDRDQATQVTVDDNPGFWISGGGHIAYHLDAQGRLVIGVERSVDRATLLWEQPKGLGFRLETSLPQDEAIALAESIR